jgi:hypothetical protein
MPQTPLILMLDEPTWRLGFLRDGAAAIETLDHDEQATTAQRAAALRAALDAQNTANPRITIALPAQRCLVAPIDTTGLPRANRAQAMRFAMEEHIPAPVEQLATDFIARDHDALGLATDQNELRTAIDALNDAGFDVASASPIDLLALQAISTDALQKSELVLMQTHGSRISLFAIDPAGVQPIGWSWFDDHADTLRQNLGLYNAQRPTNAPASISVFATGLSESNLAALRAIDEIEIVGADTHCSDQLATLALSQPNRHKSIAVDFLPDLQQGATPTGAAPRSLLVAGLLFAIALPGSIMLRVAQYDSITAGQRAVQQTYYEEYFNRPAPTAGIVRHFNSELNKANMGLATAHARAPYPAATDLMRHTLELIPAGAQLAIQRFEFEPDRLRIEGHAARNEDAYALEAALEALYRLQPRVEQIEDSGGRESKRVFTLIANESAPQTSVATNNPAGGDP